MIAFTAGSVFSPSPQRKPSLVLKRSVANVSQLMTLDLIMEKNRNMSLSEEEKEEIKTRELLGRLRGLIQKGLEGTLSVSQLRAEIESERKKTLHHEMIRGIGRGALLQ